MIIAHCKQTVAAALLLLLLAACSESPSPQTSDDPGEAAYLRHCATCHGTDGLGRPPVFPPLARSEWMELPPETLSVIALLGLRGEIEVAGQRYHGLMPPLRHLSDGDLAAIIRYTHERWGSGEIDWSAEDVAALRPALDGHRMPDGRGELDEIMGELP